MQGVPVAMARDKLCTLVAFSSDRCKLIFVSVPFPRASEMQFACRCLRAALRHGYFALVSDFRKTDKPVRISGNHLPFHSVPGALQLFRDLVAIAAQRHLLDVHVF